MISFFTSTCVAPRAARDEHTGEVTGHLYGLAHILAPGADLLIGITALVVGILSLTYPSMGINLSTGLQGAIIGGATIYAGIAFLHIVSLIKYSCTNKFLIGRIETIGSFPSRIEE